MNDSIFTLLKTNPSAILNEAEKIKDDDLTIKEAEAFNKAREFLDKIKEIDNEKSRRRVAILSIAYLYKIISKNK